MMAASHTRLQGVTQGLFGMPGTDCEHSQIRNFGQLARTSMYGEPVNGIQSGMNGVDRPPVSAQQSEDAAPGFVTVVRCAVDSD